MPQHWLREIKHFFRIYKGLEGTRVSLLGWEQSEAAMREVTVSIARYRERHGDGDARSPGGGHLTPVRVDRQAGDLEG